MMTNDDKICLVYLLYLRPTTILAFVWPRVLNNHNASFTYLPTPLMWVAAGKARVALPIELYHGWRTDAEGGIDW